MMSHSLSFFHISLHRFLTVSETIPPSLSVPLPTPASTVSSPVLPAETKDPPASKPVRYVCTHRLKVPASEPIPAIPSPVDGSIPPSASPSNLDVSIALRKGKRSCTDHLIFNFISYDNLNLTFRQFALCLLSLYPDLIQRLYWYLPGNRQWMRRWKLLLLEELGSWFSH